MTKAWPTRYMRNQVDALAKTLLVGIFALVGVAIYALDAVGEPLAQFSVPFEISGDNHIIVEANVNGQGPYSFILDTGALMTVVFPHLTTSLEMNKIPNGSRRLGGAGGMFTADTYRLGEVALMEGPTYNVPVTIELPQRLEDGSPLGGIIGADLLKSYVVAFDPHRNLMDFYPANSAFGDDWPTIPVSRLGMTGAASRQPDGSHRDSSTTSEDGPGPMLIAKVSVNGIEMSAIIDTGAARSIMNPAALHRLGYTLSDERLAAAEPVKGAAQRGIPAKKLEDVVIRLGERDFDAIALTVADLPLFRIMRDNESGAIIMGLDVLGQTGFVVDYADGALRLAIH